MTQGSWHLVLFKETGVSLRGPPPTPQAWLSGLPTASRSPSPSLGIWGQGKWVNRKSRFLGSQGWLWRPPPWLLSDVGSRTQEAFLALRESGSAEKVKEKEWAQIVHSPSPCPSPAPIPPFLTLLTRSLLPQPTPVPTQNLLKAECVQGAAAQTRWK